MTFNYEWFWMVFLYCILYKLHSYVSNYNIINMWHAQTHLIVDIVFGIYVYYNKFNAGQILNNKNIICCNTNKIFCQKHNIN